MKKENKISCYMICLCDMEFVKSLILYEMDFKWRRARIRSRLQSGCDGDKRNWEGIVTERRKKFSILTRPGRIAAYVVYPWRKRHCHRDWRGDHRRGRREVLFRVERRTGGGAEEALRHGKGKRKAQTGKRRRREGKSRDGFERGRTPRRNGASKINE